MLGHRIELPHILQAERRRTAVGYARRGRQEQTNLRVPREAGFSLARAYVAGDASGTDPAGTGSATWTGIGEATATGTLTRLRGTATVTIVDPPRTRVGVAIDVPGHDIGAPGWADMPLNHGRFGAGTAGTDSLEGSFHGPGHEVAWGVFDTTG